MGFIDKVSEFATGKTKEERQQEKAAMSIIRRKVRSEAFQERQTQSIRVAREREKVKAEREIKKMRQPRQSFSMLNYGNPFGQPRQLSQATPRVAKRKNSFGFNLTGRSNVLGF